MPKIPQITQQVGVRNAPSVRQNISASPDAFGAATGRALQNLGNVGQNIAADLQNQRNVVEVQKAYFEADKALQQYLHDPDNGVYSRKGINASGTYQEVMSKMPEIAAQYTQNLSGAQRELFDRQWRAISTSALRSAANHEGQEMRVAKVQAAEAIVGLQAENAVLNYNNPEEVDVHVTAAIGALRSIAQGQGWSQALEQVKTKELMSQIYSGVFENHFREGNIAAAQKVLADNSEWMSSKLVTKLTNDLRVKAQDIRVESNADLIFSQYSDDYGAAMKAAKETASGEERTALERRISTLFQMQEKAENDRMNDLYYKGFEAVRGAGSRNAAEQVAMQFTDQEVRSRLLNLVDQKFPLVRASGGAGGAPKLTDEEKALKKLMASYRENVAFDAIASDILVRPEEYNTRAAVVARALKDNMLDPKKVDELWDIAQGDGVYGKYNAEAVSKALPKSATYAALGIEPPDKRSRNMRIRPEDMPPGLMSVVWDAAKENGGNLTGDELRKVVSAAITEGTVKQPGYVFGDLWHRNEGIRYYEAVEQGRADDFNVLSTMDEADREEMRAFVLAGQRKQGADIDTSDDTANVAARAMLAASAGVPTNTPRAQEMLELYTWAKRQSSITVRDPDTGQVRDMPITKPMLQNPATWDTLIAAYLRQTGGK